MKKGRTTFRDVAASEAVEGGKIQPGLGVINVPDDATRRLVPDGPEDA